ncbi:MAG TPA: hypothetical protein VFQ72_01720 [Candidatus Paceibacterota bacterium]|nr:hypothetical protein [Candidatus Paceibacterota bacterium]
MKTIAKMLFGLSAALFLALFSSTASAQTTSARLVNIATRGPIAANDPMIAGFVTGPGTSQKRVLIRVVGPSLAAAPFNISGAIKAPKLELMAGPNVLRTNTGWESSGDGPLNAKAAAACGAFPLQAGSADCVLTVSLFPNSAYTVVASGLNGSTGTALIEVYEVPDSFVAP